MSESEPFDKEISSPKNSDSYHVKFTKKKDMVALDWPTINRKLEKHQKIKKKKVDHHDILFSMYDEDEGSKYKRESLMELNPLNIKKSKMTSQQMKEKINQESTENKGGKEFLNEFKKINEMLENKMKDKEKDLEKLIMSDFHCRKK